MSGVFIGNGAQSLGGGGVFIKFGAFERVTPKDKKKIAFAAIGFGNTVTNNHSVKGGMKTLLEDLGF